MKRPLVWLFCCQSAGILLAEFQDFSLTGLMTLGVLTCFAGLMREKERDVFLAGTVLILSAFVFEARSRVISPHDLRILAADTDSFATMRGTLLETPVERVTVRNGKESWRTVCQMRVVSVRWKEGDWMPAHGVVLCRNPGILPHHYFKGATVEVSGALTRPEKPRIKGLFDYRRYLERQHIYYQLRTEGAVSWQLLSPLHIPWDERFLAWAKRMLSIGIPEDEALRLEFAMTLGWKTALTEDVTEPFMQSGTMHIFAISGLHISLIAYMLTTLFRMMQMPRRACGILVIPAIWLYTAATGWQPSAVRSTLMCSLVMMGWTLQRPLDLMNSLGAAAFIILMFQPEQLFQASFQLSFLVVASLALIMPWIQDWLNGVLQSDPFLQQKLIPAYVRWWHDSLRFVGLLVGTAVAAWLGSLPITAYYFNLVTPNSLLSNLLIVPASTGALICNVAALLTGAWFPFLAELFNNSGWLLMKSMIWVSDQTILLPGAYFYVQKPHDATILAYYGFGLLLLTRWFWKKNWRHLGLLAAGVTFTLFLLQSQIPQAPSLHILPMAGGHALVDETSADRTGAIDAGDESTKDFVLIPFLRTRGVDRMQFLFLTHGDVRHVAGAPHLERSYSIPKIITSGEKFRSTVYRRVVEELSLTGKVQQTALHAELENWLVLHPPAKSGLSNADDLCLVLKRSIGGVSILNVGDLGRSGQDSLLASGQNIKSDILITGLPGKGEPISKSFVEGVEPQLICIMDDTNTTQSPASSELRKRLRQLRCRVVYASELGSLHFQFSRGECRVTSALGKPFTIQSRPAALLSTRTEI